MLLPSQKHPPAAAAVPEYIPTEVKIWLDKGWTIMPSERRGYVIAGKKKMRGLGMIGLALGVIMLTGFAFKHVALGIVGAVLVVGAWLDFRFNTKPPTKFFPEPGEKKRVLDR